MRSDEVSAVLQRGELVLSRGQVASIGSLLTARAVHGAGGRISPVATGGSQELFVKGARWADASEADFKRKAARIRSDYAEPKRWAEETRAAVIETHSWQSIARQYDVLLEELAR